jgi:outer membrane lipoprotein-sorting protein
VPDVSYEKRKIWVDKERFVPMQEELFAKSGQLLKKTVMSDVKQFGKRWYPTRINYKDMLKDGQGTDFIATEILFDVDIPETTFNKASLKK